MSPFRIVTLILAATALAWVWTTAPTVYRVALSGLSSISNGVLDGRNYGPEAMDEIQRRLEVLDADKQCSTAALEIIVPIRQKMVELALRDPLPIADEASEAVADTDAANEPSEVEETAEVEEPPEVEREPAASAPRPDEPVGAPEKPGPPLAAEPAAGEESEAATAKKEAVAAALRDLKEDSRRLVSCSPTQAFGWLTLFWSSLVETQGKAPEFEALRMSYKTAPREGWIARRRSILVMPLYDQLPPDVQTMAVAELVGLLEDHYAEAGLDILTSATPAGRAKVLEAIRALPQDVRDRLRAESENAG